MMFNMNCVNQQNKGMNQVVFEDHVIKIYYTIFAICFMMMPTILSPSLHAQVYCINVVAWS